MVNRSSSRGFTLIELLVVIAIIGILAAVAIPQFFQYRARGYDAGAQQTIREAAVAEEAYFQDTEHYVDCVGTINCQNTLPGFYGSNGVVVDMFQVPAAGLVPEYFTGRAYHPKGMRSTVATAFMWNSNQGGQQ